MTIKRNLSNYLFYFISTILVLFLFNSNNIYASESVATQDVISKSLCNLIFTLSGGVAKAICIIALMASTIGFLSGKMQWMPFLTLIIGIFLLMGAAPTVNFITKQMGNDSIIDDSGVGAKCGTQRVE
jgi:type IV secretory pathway VirB2 component (pilin)